MADLSVLAWAIDVFVDGAPIQGLVPFIRDSENQQGWGQRSRLCAYSPLNIAVLEV